MEMKGKDAEKIKKRQIGQQCRHDGAAGRRWAEKCISQNPDHSPAPSSRSALSMFSGRLGRGAASGRDLAGSGIHTRKPSFPLLLCVFNP